MMEPVSPGDEQERLAALDALAVLYTPAEERFDRITRLAARVLDVPIALVSLVSQDVQWFKSAHGLGINETPRSVSFCGHAILGNDALVVPDTLTDSRFAGNPLVTGEPRIRFYAGQPLRAPDGQKVGTLCIIDRRPRRLSDSEMETLRDLAGLVESELSAVRLSDSQLLLIGEIDDLRRRALIDPLTSVWNRGAITDVLAREAARAVRAATWLTIVLADADRFKSINDTYGHPGGDAVLRELARRMRAAVRPFDAIGRYGGEEFLLVLVDCPPAEAATIAERVRRCVADAPIVTSRGELRATVSIGYISARAPAAESIEPLIAAADAALYRAKANGRDRVERADL